MISDLLSEPLSRSCSPMVSTETLSPVNSVLFNEHVLCCFGLGERNIFRCQYSFLISLLREHGMNVDSRSIADCRTAIIYHVAMGMCSGEAGESCKIFSSDLSQHNLRKSVVNSIMCLCRKKQLCLFDLRFLCSAIGISLPALTTIDHCLKLFDGIAIENTVFDLLCFFTQYEHATKQTIYQWCSLHGIHPSGKLKDVKLLLLKHVIGAECNLSVSNHRYSACHSVVLQTLDCFPDADKRGFILSILCITEKIPVKTLQTVAEIVTGAVCRTFDRSLIQEQLCSFLFRLRRGRAFLFTVIHALHSSAQFSQWCQLRKNWPTISNQSQKEAIKTSFEERVKDLCTFQSICASCSIQYSHDLFTVVHVSDIDLSPLQIRADCGFRRSSTNSGTLFRDDQLFANCFVNENGVIEKTGSSSEDMHIILCSDCLHALQRSRVPKYAVANYLFLGVVPNELHNLTPVEESMIALCRARLIMVQLKSVRGSGQCAQHAFRGHTIFHQQDIGKIATHLPPSIEEIVSHVCVLFIGPTKPHNLWIRQHAKPLVVRADVVRRALIWLKNNNPLYASVNINHTVLNEIEDAGGLPYKLEFELVQDISTATVTGHVPEVNMSTCDSACEPPVDIEFENVVITDLDHTATPKQMREAALRHLQSGKAFFMYGHSPTPENEFHNTNLFPSLYPSLFPYGSGGFEDKRRVPLISMSAHVSHLLNIDDARFREHPSFIFSVFNILQRREVIERTTMRIRQSSFASKAHIYANLQPETIKRVALSIEQGEYSFERQDEKDVCELMRDVHALNTTVQGSAAARLKMRNEIRAMILTQGAPV
jgi:Helitron helicase-like domain at N-terminus